MTRMESKDARIQRFQDGSPVEIIETLLNSINTFFNPEIQAVVARDSWNLALLGIHAVALTVAKGLFDKSGPAGYQEFLTRFVDSAQPGRDVSAIAEEIHSWRNVVAHQWLSQRGHDFAFDTALTTGWRRRGDVLHFNPRTYADAYLGAFGADGKIWHWQDMLTNELAHAAKQRMIEKFVRE